MTRRVTHLNRQALVVITERPLTEAELARRQTGVPSPTDRMVKDIANRRTEAERGALRRPANRETTDAI